MKDFISWEKKEDLSTPQARVLLQLSTAAVTEVMHEPAKLLRPAMRLLSIHFKHKVKDVRLNLSQSSICGYIFISQLQTARAAQAVAVAQLSGAGWQRSSPCVGAEATFFCSWMYRRHHHPALYSFGKHMRHISLLAFNPS